MNSIGILETAEVFRYFKEICAIPHGSGNTQAISDYCVGFAREHGLKFSQDELGNVIIFKDASKGRENEEGIILQGHIDMVAVKEPHSSHDFTKDGLRLKVDGDWLYAEDTSLGGDDGIAVAYALAVLASDEISHPALEVILTVDEEIGLLGATALDISEIKGKYLLNIDSEEEGIILVSCAGGLSGEIRLPVDRKNVNGSFYEITVGGLLGGHSGTEIDKERCNAIVLMGRVLYELKKEFAVSLVSFVGGEKDNAIAKDCKAVICLEDTDATGFLGRIKELGRVYAGEYITSDPGLTLGIVESTADVKEAAVLTDKAFEKLVFMLRNIPCGVTHDSVDIKGLVETSMNVGIAGMDADSDCFRVTVSVRSSVNSRKAELSDKVRFLTEFLGGEYAVHGEYPAWPYRHESKLRTRMVEIYEEMFGSTPKVEAIHAGLECGILLEKCPRLDAVSFGPDIMDIHTIKEKLSISSVERTWKYLVAIIERL